MDADVLADPSIRTNPHLRAPVTNPKSIRKPVIAAINGACAGIGLVLVLNCDLRFASTTAKLTTAFAHRGTMAEHGIAYALPRVGGVANALDLLFSARMVVGQEALDLGLLKRDDGDAGQRTGRPMI